MEDKDRTLSQHAKPSQVLWSMTAAQVQPTHVECSRPQLHWMNENYTFAGCFSLLLQLVDLMSTPFFVDAAASPEEEAESDRQHHPQDTERRFVQDKFCGDSQKHKDLYILGELHTS